MSDESKTTTLADWAHIPQTKVPAEGDKPLNLRDMQQIARAAGHGHGHKGFANHPNPWFSLEDNVRPSYDVTFIQTFNPDVVDHLLERLIAAEEKLAGFEQVGVKVLGPVDITDR